MIKVWSWRQANQQAQIPSTTKLVLFNLSVYMNEMGQGCFPSIQQQAFDTSLTERSICTHLQIAKENGFLKIRKHGFGGKEWARNEYTANYPEGTELGSMPYEKALNVLPKGTESDDIKALNDVQSNTPNNTPVNSPTNTSVKPTQSYPEKFEQLWSIWPRHEGKRNALKAYQQATKRSNHDEIINGCHTIANAHRDCSTPDRYIPHLATWLNRDGWHYDPATIRRSNDPASQTAHQKRGAGATAMVAGHRALQDILEGRERY